MDRQILEEARRTIELLRDTVTVLHRELEEARTHGAGEALTAEALHYEIAQMRASLAERDARIAQLEEALHLLEERRRREAEGPSLSEDALAGRLQYYYRDFLNVDASRLGKEDADRLYEVMKYLFGELRKAGFVVKLK